MIAQPERILKYIAQIYRNIGVNNNVREKLIYLNNHVKHMNWKEEKKLALKKAKKLEKEDREIKSIDELKKEDKEFQDETNVIRRILLMNKKKRKKSPKKKISKSEKRKWR